MILVMHRHRLRDPQRHPRLLMDHGADLPVSLCQMKTLRDIQEPLLGEACETQSSMG